MSYATPGESAPNLTANSLARGLGWFSLALGATELLSPHVLTRMLGMRGGEDLVRAYGVREIASGVGILTSRNPAPWIWSRVAGDAIDMATLGSALTGRNPRKPAVAIAMVAVAGVTMLDLLCEQALDHERQAEQMRLPARDYSDRTGFHSTPADMHGAASDFSVPEEYRAPRLMRPWTRS